MSAGWIAELRPVFPAAAQPSLCPAAFVAAASSVLGAGPVAWAGEVARSVDPHVRSAIPRLADLSPDSLQRPVEACAIFLLETLHSGAGVDAAQFPEFVVTGNRDLVHGGIELDALLRTIWISHAHVVEQLLAFMEGHVSEGKFATEARHAMQQCFAATDVITTRLVAEFIAERDAWLDSVPALRRQVADDLIADRPTSVRQPAVVLGLDLDRHLVAAVLWARSGVSVTSDPPDLEVLASRLISVLGPASSLILPGTDSAVWVWMGFRGAARLHLASKLRSSLSEPEAAGVALGPVRSGVSGFRQSHVAALRARRVGEPLRARGGDWLTDHADVELVSLLTDDPEHAGWFVRDQLGRLAGGDPRTAALRETLRVYLRFGRSRSAAAEALHIVPNTVGYRVRQAVELLGTDLPHDAFVLRAALEMHDLITAPLP